MRLSLSKTLCLVKQHEIKWKGGSIAVMKIFQDIYLERTWSIGTDDQE